LVTDTRDPLLGWMVLSRGLKIKGVEAKFRQVASLVVDGRRREAEFGWTAWLIAV